MLAKKYMKLIVFFFFLFSALGQTNAQSVYDSLLRDIPEPPEARGELPSPVPMVYEFMGAMMSGQSDVCLANFEVETFLKLMYGRNLSRLEQADYNELFSYQIQTHRNEFKFLSKIMNRVAEGARIDYSNPRYHGKIQSKVVVRLDTNRGRFDFIVYCCYMRDRWYVYDYVLNNQRLTQSFRTSLNGISPQKYLYILRPFYDQKLGYRAFRNKEFDFGINIPRSYELKENISEALLASLTSFEGRFLLHVQAATYDTPQNLSQVGVGIKNSLMPFEPRLYDQWKGELAGVEIGNILFHFKMGDKRLFAHMVLIPLGKKLVVLNFYHSSLQMMKHMTNIREKMISSITLPKLEMMGGIMPGEIPDELTLEGDFSDDDFSGDDLGTSLEDSPMNYSENTPTQENSWESSTPASQGQNDYSDYSDYSENTSDDEPEMLTPTTYTNDYEPSGDDEDYIPPPPTGSYGDGNFGDDDDDYYPGDDYGNEVVF